MAAVRAVLFDFGGTLADYDDLLTSMRAAFPATLVRVGIGGDPDELLPRFRAGMGAAVAPLLQQPFYLHRDVFRQGYRGGLMALGVRPSAADLDWMLAQLRDRLRIVTLRAGALDTLAALRQRGLPLGIVSNADEDQLGPAIAATGLAAYVDFVVSSEMARSCKPDAGIFRAALDQAGCPAAEAVYVGDTPQHDVVGAHRAGLRAVLITDRATIAIDRRIPAEGEGQPDAVIDELPELLPLLFPEDAEKLELPAF